MVFSKKTKITILCILIALTLAFIWGNSLLPASASEKLSDSVKEALEQVLPADFFKDSQSDDGNLIRKLAHFTEFMFLGAELTMLLWEILKDSLTTPLMCGLLAAVCDETIQIFIEGRGSSLKDVWIDFAGVLVGTVLILLLKRFRGRRQRRSTQTAYGRHYSMHDKS
ncbi:MAG: VanZ family protein [Lachnospiraceae bacterium]|nr:VanZ family protein [Lachnospiraceae bacterium]